MGNKTSSEKVWILIVRLLGMVIGFLPFIPNTLFYLGFKQEKFPIEYSDFVFILIGFVFVWGSAHFGTWANAIGKNIVNKTSK